MDKMRKYIFFVLIILSSVTFSRCFRHKTSKYSAQKYEEYKNDFDKNLTQFFPESIANLETEYIDFFDNRNTSKNNYALMLYEYNVLPAVVDSAVIKARSLARAVYGGSDSCLLIVNKFETKETNQSIDPIAIIDSSNIERDCYNGQLPVPNFVDYRTLKAKQIEGLDTSFKIYVFEASHISSWGTAYNNMLPNPQMPMKWRNGYSKGMAISEKNKTVIYWLVIW